MKIICICKTFKGRSFAISSLDSIYNHIDKMIYVHGVTDWLGRPGNNVREVVEGTADPDKKLIHLSAPAKTTQAQQYDVAIDYILGKGIEYDYIMLLDTDEVMTEDSWNEIQVKLDANAQNKTPVLAYTCHLETYLKSPFYRITPRVALKPVLFIHRAAIKPGVIGIRGSTFAKGAHVLNTVVLHHFTSVRLSLDDVWEKHETSCGSESEPIVDKEEWIRTVWNRLPYATNCLPLKRYTHLWPGVEVVKIDDLPQAVRKNPLVLAWQTYSQVLPEKKTVTLTPADLMRHNLPPDFGPTHKLYKFPSFRTRYLRLLVSGPGTPKTAPSAAASQSRPVDPSISTAPKKPPKVVIAKNPGSLCVTSTVSGLYQWYIPIFLFCLKRAIPDAKPVIYTRGPCILPEPWKFLCTEIPDEYAGDGYTTAALRFCHSDTHITGFGYVFITDIDIIMQPESISLVDQHMRTLQKNNLECYDNYISLNTTTMKKVPGVHFVTKEWWARTAAAREKYLKLLKETGALSFDFDELMLYNIIMESGLNEPPKLPNLWAHHGVHLGDYRWQIETKRLSRHKMQGDLYMFVQELLADRAFIEIMNQCSERVPVIGKIFEHFRKMYYL